MAKSTIQQVLVFCLIFFWGGLFFVVFVLLFLLSLGLVFEPSLGDLSVSENPSEFCASHYLIRFVHLPSNSIFKFQCLAQFPVDHLSKLVMSSLLLLL